MDRKTLFILLLVSFTGICFAGYPLGNILRQYDFNQDNALKTWDKMILNGLVDYELLKKGSNGLVQAKSDKACSALYNRVSYKLKEYPYLDWKWNVLKFPDLAPPKNSIEEADYAARVYVVFPFLTFSTSKFIEYVWSEKIPVGTIMDSPAGNNVKMIVVRCGKPDSKQDFYSESRNVYDDYVRAFGKKPSMSVGAVAIMCNADNTKSTAESIFDDIIIWNM